MIESVVEYGKRGALVRISTFERYAETLYTVGRVIGERLQQGNSILLCGNGGSAAEAQHISAEYVGRFSKRERISLPAIALTTDTSIITAIANDYGFDVIFERQIEGLGKQDDILIASSTSGNSANCIRAIECAKRKGMYTIGFTGMDGGAMKKVCDVVFCVDTTETAIIQEVHLGMQHILCSVAEASLPEEYDRR